MWWAVVQTTLMDVLAGRKTGGRIEGDVRVQVLPGTTRCVMHVP